MGATFAWGQVADSMLCLLLFFPSMLFYWRGIWDLFGVYIYPDDEPKNHWVTTGIGACSIIGYFVYPLLDRLFTSRSGFVYILVSRVALYVYGVLAMAYWRGVWCLADYYLLQFGWEGGAIGLGISHTLLLLLRSSRSSIFPPFSVVLDTRDDVLIPATRFQTKLPSCEKPSRILLFALDSAFTQFVIMTLGILSWRNILTVYDAIPFPDGKSDIASFGIGMVGCCVLLISEVPLARLGVHLERRDRPGGFPWRKLLYEDAVYFVVFIVECFAWRGGWNLNATYVIADPLVGGWINHLIGTVFLFSTQLMSFAAASGCAADGRDPEGESIFPTKYIRHFVECQTEDTKDTGSHAPDDESSIGQYPVNVEPAIFTVSIGDVHSIPKILEVISELNNNCKGHRNLNFVGEELDSKIKEAGVHPTSGDSSFNESTRF